MKYHITGKLTEVVGIELLFLLLFLPEVLLFTLMLFQPQGTGGFYSPYFGHSNEVMRYAFYLSILPEVAQSYSQ